MNIYAFAEHLTRREYRSEITKQEEVEAKELGYVVVFGYSDDNMEFRGAINDEFGCYDGGTVYLDKNGIIKECECKCKRHKKALEKARSIKAVWCRNNKSFTWEYDTDIPHASFEIYDDDEQYCLGIVFDINDLG